MKTERLAMAYRLKLGIRLISVRSLSKIAHIYRLIVTRVVGIQLVTQRASGKIKLHEVKAHGRVSKISAEVDYGFIATPVVKSPQTHFV